MTTIKIKRGDSYIKPLNIVDCEGELIDASGWTIYFTVRSSIPPTSTDDDTDAVIAKTIAGSATGQHTLTLTSSDTDIDPEEYVFEVQIKKADNTISSSETGAFVIQADITRSS